MTPAKPRPRHWAQSLRTRLIAFLTIALLPLGVIAVLQTLQVTQEAGRLAERDVLARTQDAAKEQVAILQRAEGAAAALGMAAARLGDATDVCAGIMADFVADNSDYVFAGYIPVDGLMVCNSGRQTVDYSDTERWEEFLANPVPMISVNRAGQVSGASVFIVFTPIVDPLDGALRGAQAVSIPHELADDLLARNALGVDVALIDRDGTVLASSTGMDDIAAFEQLDLRPEDMLIPEEGLLIGADTERGLPERPAAVVRLAEDHLFVVGLWAQEEAGAGVSFFGRTVPLFPLLMWLAGLVVAYITVSTLVLRHLSRMARQMRAFDPKAPARAFVNLPDAPTEIQDIAASYNVLLDRVATDSARLRASVSEKEGLLREVHHRVKNNLQLIASILNMQIRTTRDSDARSVLKRVQDRVLSLASIHQALYADNVLRSVRADELLEQIIGMQDDHATRSGHRVAITTEMEPVTLDPDQAVPLSLLAAEAVTNAMQFVGDPGDGEMEITLRLAQDDGGEIVLQIVNTLDPTDVENVAPPGTTLGTRLIEAFASQLEGTVVTERSDRAYDLTLRFQSYLAQ